MPRTNEVGRELEADRIAATAAQEVLQDWRYKAGIEEGRLREVNATRNMEAQRDMALLAFYQHDPAACATFCDEKLDKSGRLLGRVREWVAADA